MRVRNINARKILATNSHPTVEIEIETDHGVVNSSAPMGTSRGKYEAYQLSADDAVRKFDMIRRYFTSQDFASQIDVDKRLHEVDQTSHFREIGGNLSTAVSYAFLKAFALESKMEVWQYAAKIYKMRPKIPAPLCNIVGGWGGQSDFQEFLLLPVHQRSFAESIFKINDAYNTIGDMLAQADKNFIYGKNIESAWATSLGYDSILKIMKKVADDMLLKIGLDVAASQNFKDGFYNYRGGLRMNPHEQFDFLEGIVNKYPISYIEDPFQEDDWLSFSTAVHRWQPRIVCGDDFYATRIHRLLSSIDRKASNATIVKPNQIGTVSDAVEFAKEAQSRGIITVMSHRSGETDDNIIAHLAVAMGCDYAKFGTSGERTTKLNEMIRIEEAVNREAPMDAEISRASDLTQSIRDKLKMLESLK